MTGCGHRRLSGPAGSSAGRRLLFPSALSWLRILLALSSAVRTLSGDHAAHMLAGLKVLLEPHFVNRLQAVCPPRHTPRHTTHRRVRVQLPYPSGKGAVTKFERQYILFHTAA